MRIGRSTSSTCATTYGAAVLAVRSPPQSGQQGKWYSCTQSICSGSNGGRTLAPWPGWAPRFRGVAVLGFGGLTMSLDGGLDEFDEFLRAAANSASRRATRALNSRIRSSSSWQREHTGGGTSMTPANYDRNRSQDRTDPSE